MKDLTIAVIGGTGKSGRYVVQQLLRQQYNLRLLTRPHGDARDFDAVSDGIKGCQVVVSTLGQPKGEPSIFSEATRHVIRAMELHGVQRYIVTTGLSVNTPADRKNLQVQLATDWMYDHYPETTGDKQQEYQLLLNSSINWTMIRLPLIKETTESFGYKADLYDCAGPSISAADLGRFIVQEIEAPLFVKKAPFLYNEPL
jgi:nucleoside-diphosphate-sugar epimerase